MRTLKNALANSVNTVSARIMDMVGPKPVIDLVKKTGVTSWLPNVPSIALGTPDISLFEDLSYALKQNQLAYPLLVKMDLLHSDI